MGFALSREKSLGFFKLITISGPPYERGHQYGAQTKEVIERSLNAFHSVVEHLNPQMSRKELYAKALQFQPFIESYDHNIMEEIRGIADGAEKSLEEIMFLNARAELAYPGILRAYKELLGQCSTLAVMPEASSSGHTLVAQNWDLWIPIMRLKPYILLKIVQEDQPDMICFSEAGIIGGKIGFNSAGIGLGANALFTDFEGVDLGTPWSTICRGILNANSWHEAMKAVLRAKRSISLNFLITTVEGESICIEAAPSYKSGFVYSEDGILPHTNHFISGDVQNCTMPAFRADFLPNSISRYLRLKKLARQKLGALSIENIQDIWRDHFNYPNSICAHPTPDVNDNETSGTCVSFINDLDTKEMYVACGPPCQYEYERVPLKLS